ncbi:MAG: rhodanese-like domain-containing protein [Verrucomicrobia bacterium]|nr:rhodanese-like domain-containing protein [Verrucomicrobiota bacterium]MBI3869893.1 rhodanese-like domain-containing protein [Verrucomicrobiota bacterium]
MRNCFWILALSFLLEIVSTIHAAESAPPKTAGTPRKIQIDEFDRLRARTNHVVLDVRSPEEYKAGHVPNAVNLNVHDPAFAKQMSSLDPSKTYLVHCARGKRSALATDQMNQKGLTNVLDFSGGFDLWQKSGKPVVK